MSTPEQWILATGFLSPMFTYLDATSHKIGKVKDDKSFFNMSAATWAICCLVLPVIGLLTYLYKREALSEKAKTHPITVSFIQKLIVTLLLGCVAYNGLHFWGVIQ